MRLGFSAPAGRLRNADGARRGEKEREYAVEPRDVVQSAIDAYHAHDLDRCLSFYAADVVVKRADGTILMDGAEAVRARYAKSMSDHPNLHYDIPNRIALGDFVANTRAMARASSCTFSSGTIRLTRPSEKASSAPKVRPLNKSSNAR